MREDLLDRLVRLELLARRNLLEGPRFVLLLPRLPPRAGHLRCVTTRYTASPRLAQRIHVKRQNLGDSVEYLVGEFGEVDAFEDFEGEEAEVLGDVFGADVEDGRY